MNYLLQRTRLCTLLLLAMVGASCGRVPRAGVVVSTTSVPLMRQAVAELGEIPVELIIQTTGSPAEAEVAIAAAKALADSGAIAVVGHSNSAASLAASQVYNRAGILQLAPSTTATIYGAAGPLSFRMVQSDSAQALFLAAAAKRLARRAGGVAVLYENDEYGFGLYRDLRARGGLDIRYAGAFVGLEGVGSLRPLIEHVVALEPAVILWLARGVPLDTVWPELRRALPNSVLIASDALDATYTYQNPDGRYTGIHFVRLLDPGAENPQLRALTRRVPGVARDAEALLSYDAAQLIGAAIRDGARNGEEIAAWLHSLGRTRPPFRGVTGAIEFDEGRSCRRDWLLATVSGRGVIAEELNE